MRVCSYVLWEICGMRGRANKKLHVDIIMGEQKTANNITTSLQNLPDISIIKISGSV